MKQTNFLKKTLLLVAMMAGVSTAWADGTISIPHDLGSFISLGTSSGTNGDVATGVNLSNCNVDNSNTRTISETTNYYTIVGTVDVLIDHVTHLPGFLFQRKTTDEVDGTIVETEFRVLIRQHDLCLQ